MTTRAGHLSVIEAEGLGQQVTDWLFKDKLSYKEIKAKLAAEHNIDLSEASISKFKNFVIDKSEDFLKQNKEYSDELAKKYLNSVETLIFAADELRKKLNAYSEDPSKWKQHSTYMSLLLQELHLWMKKMGEIKPMQIIEKQEINMIQINNIVQTEIIRMIDEGHIQLESCSDHLKELYQRLKNENSG